MGDKVGLNEEVLEVKPIHGVSAVKEAQHPYLDKHIHRPRRNASRDTALGGDILERRAAQGILGTVLERIVYKRLATIWGPPEQAFIYKYNIGAVAGVKNARALAGGIEMDFVILHRPSGREQDLEVQGAHWHGPQDQSADLERELLLVASGRDFAEVWEWEIMIGDDFLDQRILQLIGSKGIIPGRVDRPLESNFREDVSEHERQT